jgi:hypothetical protein
LGGRKEGWSRIGSVHKKTRERMMADTREEVPSREEIAKLPRWAQVAFAARCARRVQPLFKVFWPEAPAEHCEAIERAIRLAESSAGSARLPAHAADADAADAARNAAEDAAKAAEDKDDDIEDAYTAAEDVEDAAKAADAADAAADAADAANAANENDEDDDEDDDEDAAEAANAVADAADAANRWGRAPSRESVVRVIRMDFEKLKAAAKKERWTNETPVPPEFFGPLWPEGEPPGWPSTAAEPTRQKKAQTASKEERLVVQAFVHGPVDDETLVDGITEIYQALNRYHILCGGTGLTIDDWQIFVRSGTRVGELV